MSDATHSPDAQSVREDIAFLRTLAEQGASGPLAGGSILLATGLIYAAASVAVWYVTTHMPSEAGRWMWPIWGSAMTSQAVTMTIIILRLKGRGRGLVAANNRSNRAFAMIWNGVGCAIMACLASFLLTAWQAHLPQVFAGFPAVILVLYGVGWTMTAASSRERWTWGVAVLSFVLTIVLGAFAGSANLPLLFALALLLLIAAPGALLIKRASVRS